MYSDKTVLIINTHAAATRVGVYRAGALQVDVPLQHAAVSGTSPAFWDLYDQLRGGILNTLRKSGVCMDEFDIIACRCGYLKTLPGGTYRIGPQMVADLRSGIYQGHLSNVGGLIAYDLGDQFNIPVVTAEPSPTDELCNSARFSGLPQIARRSVCNALSQKSAGRRAADWLGKKYGEVNLIVASLGAGISVGAHKKGRIIDVNNSMEGDGPFSAERTGSLPAGDLVRLCFSGEYSKKELLQLLTGGGGLKAYLGSADPAEIESRIAVGDREAAEAFEAMGYQTAKEIGGCAAALEGKVDAVVLTGMLARSKLFIDSLLGKISFIAPVRLDPGEHEMEALAAAALRYVNAEEELAVYA